MRTLSPGQALRQLRSAAPLVHVMTNTISQNDCANLLLAAGARPIMAEAQEEVQEIAGSCAALVLNCGIPSKAKFRAMLLAGQAANQAGAPVVLDPVGIGASAFRQEQIRHLLGALHFRVIRGNSAEIAALAGQPCGFTGVDGAAGRSSPEKCLLAVQVAARYGAIVLQSGAQDVIVDATRMRIVSGGHPAIAKVTGAGCMLSALTGAFLAIAPENPMLAALAAAQFWKCCAAWAADRMQQRGEGTGSLRAYLIDAASLLTPQALEESAAACAF